jgi:hypothetical protein
VSEYDSLIEGFDSSLPSETLGPLTDEEHQALQEMTLPMMEAEPLTATSILADQHELRVLRPDQQPAVGSHYVIWGGIPRPVLRATPFTEDEYVRTNMDVAGLNDVDGGRRERADRNLRMRYRGYLSGQLSSL